MLSLSGLVARERARDLERESARAALSHFAAHQARFARPDARPARAGENLGHRHLTWRTFLP